MNKTKAKLFNDIFDQVCKEFPETVVKNPCPKGQDPQAHLISVIVSLTLHIALDSEEERRGKFK